jgi:hypothetical protein
MDKELFEKTYAYDDYSVVLKNHSITYIFNESGNIWSRFLSGNSYITIDPEEQGGKIEIKWRDRWGSEMIFIHYSPSDLKGMFDFIMRGYKVNEKH